MIIGGNQKFRFVLSNDDTGTAGRILGFSLDIAEDGKTVFLITHHIGNSYNGRHSLLSHLTDRAGIRLHHRLFLLYIGSAGLFLLLFFLLFFLGFLSTVLLRIRLIILRKLSFRQNMINPIGLSKVIDAHHTSSGNHSEKQSRKDYPNKTFHLFSPLKHFPVKNIAEKHCLPPAEAFSYIKNISLF